MTAPTAPANTLVIAHRGAWGELPENTLEAFEEAVRVGADMIELDVRRTADGHLIAYHDPLGGLRRDELRAKRADSPPPLLRDALRQLAGRIALNVELKERGCEAEVAALLAQFGVEESLVTSFLDDVVREVKARAPQLRTGLVIGRASGEDDTLRANQAGADCLVLEAHLATAAEIPCLVWTVNDAEQIDRCLRDPAVTGLITDRPALALARRALLTGQTARPTPSSAPARPGPSGAGVGDRGPPFSA